MENIEKITDLYTEKKLPLPENILTEIGHFNVLKLDPSCVLMQRRCLTNEEIIIRSV
jgi:hypothetical protein